MLASPILSSSKSGFALLYELFGVPLRTCTFHRRVAYSRLWLLDLDQEVRFVEPFVFENRLADVEDRHTAGGLPLKRPGVGVAV